MDDLTSIEPRVITPDSLRMNTGPVTLWVSSAKYGETKSTHKPGFEQGTGIVENYDFSVPPAVLKICKEVTSIGGKAFLFGGCVRDMVRLTEGHGDDITINDYDISIHGLDDDTIKLILETNFPNVSRQKNYPIFRIPFPDKTNIIEVIPPKKQVVTAEGTQITTDPIQNIAEAAFSRDLPINSMVYDPLTGILYDPYNGLRDLRSRTLNIVNPNPDEIDGRVVLRIYAVCCKVWLFSFTRSSKCMFEGNRKWFT
jgi:hypothetical protein